MIVNRQPAGKYLGERFHRAGGVPAVQAELLAAGLLDGSAKTVTGRSVAESIAGRASSDREVITTVAELLRTNAGFMVLTGNLFDFAIMKTSVIGDDFRHRYLEQPGREGVFESRAIVFESPDDYHARRNDPALAIDEDCLLVMRGAGPARVARLGRGRQHAAARRALAARRDEPAHAGRWYASPAPRQPSILNAAPEAAAGGGLAWLQTGDRVRVDPQYRPR